MLDVNFFRDELSKFSCRFKDHAYDQYTIDLFYKELNYLSALQLKESLDGYLMKVDHKYFLPCPFVLISYISRVYQKPTLDKNYIKSNECYFCYSTGIVKASPRKGAPRVMQFKCNKCNNGKEMKDLLLWSKEIENNFKSEYEAYEQRQKENPVDVKLLIKKLDGQSIKGKLPPNLKTFNSLVKGVLENKKDLKEKINQ